MLEDRFGLPLTTASPQATETYIRAVDLMLSANIGAEPLLDAALTADPNFAWRISHGRGSARYERASPRRRRRRPEHAASPSG